MGGTASGGPIRGGLELRKGLRIPTCSMIGKDPGRSMMVQGEMWGSRESCRGPGRELGFRKGVEAQGEGRVPGRVRGFMGVQGC